MIVFGLGNPGERYMLSRHNLGFMVVDSLAIRLDLRFRLHEEAFVARGKYAGEELTLVKPLSYMNLSGRVVRNTLQEKEDDFLVVVDDVDLSFGQLRLRKLGGTSGHNGLTSIQEYLGTEEFARLRIGIGPRPETGELSDYVLSTFSPPELKQLPDVIDEARDAVLFVMERGMDAAMNRVNAPDM